MMIKHIKTFCSALVLVSVLVGCGGNGLEDKYYLAQQRGFLLIMKFGEEKVTIAMAAQPSGAQPFKIFEKSTTNYDVDGDEIFIDDMTGMLKNNKKLIVLESRGHSTNYKLVDENELPPSFVTEMN